MNEPLISVMMPVYNCEKYIGEAIKSILDQTYKKWELLICDDASTDRSYQVILGFSSDVRIRIFQNPVNLKEVRTRNKLLALAEGELFTFQDADDYSDRYRFEKMVKEFRSNPRLGLLASQVAYVTSKGKLLRVSNKPTTYECVKDSMYDHNVVGGAIMMMRKEILNSVGGKFRDYFDCRSYHDYDLSLLLAEKYEAYSLPDVLYYYRQHGNSTSQLVDIDRAITKSVVIHLATQRKARGSDDLIDNHDFKVDELIAKLKQPYLRDPSLLYREYAAGFMYNQLYQKAIKTSWEGLRRRPFSLANWRTFQYCIRRSLVRKFSGS